MSYNRIRRGPMGGDQYTQIHNGVFRDTRLTPQAMAVFGYISTHAQGWETSAAGIARGMGTGEGTVRAALARLKELHYVWWGQDRDSAGKVGSGWYFVTDLPAQLAAMGIDEPSLVEQAVGEALASWLDENPRSEPVALEAYRARPAETRPKRVYPRSLRK